MSSTGAEPYPAAAGEILSALKASFSTPHFIRDSTGHDSERAADALALGMYRSGSSGKLPLLPNLPAGVRIADRSAWPTFGGMSAMRRGSAAHTR